MKTTINITNCKDTRNTCFQMFIDLDTTTFSQGNISIFQVKRFDIRLASCRIEECIKTELAFVSNNDNFITVIFHFGSFNTLLKDNAVLFHVFLGQLSNRWLHTWQEASRCIQDSHLTSQTVIKASKFKADITTT